MPASSICVATLALLLIAAPAARGDDRSAAEAEFVKARRLMKEGKTAEACQAFARSDELDPQNGTKYNLALCQEEAGNTATAFMLFRELAEGDSNAARKKDSAQRAEALEPKLTRLLVTTRGATPGLIVTRDGVDVTRLMGVEDPIDPGRYQIAASADGYQTWNNDLEIRAGDATVITVEIPALKRPGEGEVKAPPVPDEPVERGGAPGRGRRIAGIAVGGAGVIAAGVGLVFGVRARSTWAKVVDLCGDDLDCESDADFDRARGLVRDARGAGNLSTILVGAGAVAIAAGVVLFLTAPDGEPADATALRVTPQLGDDGVGLVVAGGF